MRSDADTKKSFIRKARLKHGNKYDYSKVEYAGSNSKVQIVCPEHGEFVQLAASHLRGCGCIECGRNRRGRNLRDWNTFIEAARLAHGNVYSYDVKRSKHPTVVVICPEHGSFTSWRTTHLNGSGCSKCYHESRRKSCTQYESEVRELCSLKVLEDYVNASHKIKHKCACGAVWKVAPKSVLHAGVRACPDCTYAEALRDVNRRLKATHGNSVQLVGQLRGTTKPHRFRCNECNSTWKALPTTVISGTGCPKCAVGRRVRAFRKSGYRYKEIKLGGRLFKVQGYEPQAIQWILNNTSAQARDIKVDASGEVPTIQYRTSRRRRTYFPDMFIPKRNLIVEVKSIYTLGLATGRNWRKNQAKAKAALDAGYKFAVLVMSASGKRVLKLPKDWHSRTRQSVLAELQIK